MAWGEEHISAVAMGAVATVVGGGSLCVKAAAAVAEDDHGIRTFQISATSGRARGAGACGARATRRQFLKLPQVDSQRWHLKDYALIRPCRGDT